MPKFEIVAHRGVPFEAPENTIASFTRAVELGADAVEFDVRLTADRVPVVYHYYYLDEYTSGHGTIFSRTLEELRGVRVHCRANPGAAEGGISTLDEILGRFCGKIGMDIEIKGPEPEAPEIIGIVLNKFRKYWPSIEMTSFNPALLLDIQRVCPGIAADLLYPPSENCMKFDVVAYEAAQRARSAGARAVYLHSTQLSPDVVKAVRSQGLDIHAWDVNDMESLRMAEKNGISRICTDLLRQAMDFRDGVSKNP